MIRQDLKRLTVVGISFIVILIPAIFSKIAKLSLPFKIDINNTLVKNDNVPENTKQLVHKKIFPLQFNKTIAQELGHISQNEAASIERLTPTINFTLPKFKTGRPIVFLHIGKNGGSSFDYVIGPVIRNLGGTYIGNKHFDWSYIETIRGADVVVLLREPVSRAVSHYYFMRKWSKNNLNQGPLPVYLKHPIDMLETRDCWQDGQASVSWLTGTHVANWVGINASQVPSRERLSLNITEMCFLAAKRLESTFWFGILEDKDRSFELLQHQLGLPKTINFPKKNLNIYPGATENDTRILTSLMPQDIWLYEYAKVIFEARWNYYKTGIYKHPDMPPLPTLETVPCISTRFILLCKKGPLSPLYFANPNAAVQSQRLPDDITNKLKLDKDFFTKANISHS